MMKCWFFVFMLVLGGYCVCAQEEVKWLTIAEAEQLNQKQERPFLFDFYTDWCGWCKHMDKTTYSDPSVVAFINRNFYPIRVNAESADTVVFRNKIYAPVRNGSKSISGLAVEMLGGKMSYPSTVFVYDPGKVNLVVPGYLDVVKMQGFLVYFSENVWQTTDVNRFLADFEKVFGVDSKKYNPATYWTSFQDLEKKRQEKNKKILLFMEASWNNCSKMMERLVFPDSLFSIQAQEHFYCLQLDVQSKDTITFMTHVFRNVGQENNELHQLAIALSDKVLKVPSVYIFSEEGKLLETLPYYMDSSRGELILDYIGSDTFKTMSWEDYTKVRERERF